MALSRAKKLEDCCEVVALYNEEKWPKDTSWTDITIVASQTLQTCNHLAIKRLQCDTQAGNLIIRGEVGSYYLKQLAQETLRSLNANHRIVNQLDVICQGTDVINDNQT
jgi:hypothetical protein